MVNIREVFDVVDLHAGGEPLRLVTSGYPPIPGSSVLDKRAYLEAHWDHYRKRLMFEPWGHADMYGCLLVPPERPDSLYGLIFMHNEGYSTMCGHATIAVTTWLVESGQVLIPDGAEEVEVRLDVPSGQVEAHARLNSGRVVSVWFENVPAFAVALEKSFTVQDRQVRLDIGFGGAYYAVVESHQLDLAVEPEHVDALREWAAAIKAAVEPLELTRHPIDARLNGLYGIIFTDGPHQSGNWDRNLTVFADGQIDRSPCGSCVSTRMALLDAKGVIARGETYRVESVIDTVFTGQVIGDADPVGPYRAVRTVIEGSAHVIGFRRFFHNPEDPLEPFFIR